jgi:hypothetical protein
MKTDDLPWRVPAIVFGYLVVFAIYAVMHIYAIPHDKWFLLGVGGLYSTFAGKYLHRVSKQ